MDRSYLSNTSGSAPTAPGSPATGYPQSGNPGTGTPATRPGPYWYHMITESLRNLVASAGLTPLYTDLTLVAKAVAKLAGLRTGALLPARIAATTNLGLTGLAVIDGVTPVAGDRILVTGQTATKDNGVYIAAAGAWARSDDTLQPGAIYPVSEGATGGNSTYRLTTAGPLVIGTTGLTFVRDAALRPSNNLSDVANAATARSNLSAAASGANTDITSLNAPSLGAATATTAAAGTNTIQVATTAGVIAEITNQFTRTGQQSLAASGYQRLPGGLIIQWANTASFTADSTTFTTTFPITFPNACLAVVMTDFAATANAAVPKINSVTTSNFGASQFQVQGSATNHSYRYIAIGN